MATISAPDLVLLRTAINKVTPYFSVLQPTVLLAALVNDGSAARGQRSIPYDTGTGSGFATIEAGQTLEVDTADGTFRTRVKSISGNQTSGTIVIDENGIVWGNNLVIRIYHNYEIIPVPPVIRSQVFYKFYDDAYVAQNEEPPPVAIIGSHLAGFLSAGSTVFQLNSSSSYATADGASIASRVWSCVHMGGGTTGITISNTTTANPTLTLTIAGQYWLKCIVTDSNGKTQTTYRAIFIYDSSNLPYKDFTIQPLSGDWSTGGWRASLNVTGDVTLDDFPDRALCLLWYVGKFGSTEDYVNLWAINADNIILGGYIRQDSGTDQWSDGTGSVSFEITTPDGVIDNISELGSISLNAVANPGFWYEYESWMTAGRSIHHLIKYHSYGVLQCWDVLGLNEDTRGVLQAEFTEGALLQQINGLSFDRGIYAKMACDFMGRFHLVKDIAILNDAGRAALDTVMTILEADISGVVTLVRAPEESVSFAELNGFSFNGSVSTPFISILPGYRESNVSYIMPNLRGSGTLSIGNQILSSQTDSNERIGRVMAQQNNNPRELRFSTPYSGLGAFDIINSIGWYEWGVGDADLKRNTELFQRLLICRSITHTFDHSAGTVQTELAFEPEAFGPDGVQGNYPTGYPAVKPPEPDWTPPDTVTAVHSILIYSDTVDSKGYARLVTNNPLALSSQVEIASVAESFLAGMSAVLSTTKVLVLWLGASGFACKVLTISGGAISNVGTLQTLGITGPSSPYFAVRALTDAKAVVVYQDESGGLPYDAAAVILDISGDTVTAGSVATLDATEQPRQVDIARLSSTKVLATWQDQGGGGARAIVLDISGSTITPGTNTQYASGAVGNSAAAISSDVVVTFYGTSAQVPTSEALYNISGTTFSQGSPNTLDAGGQVGSLIGYPGHRFTTQVTDTRLVAAWVDDLTLIQTLCGIDYDGGGAVSGGTPLGVDTLLVSTNQFPQISTVSDTKVVVAYEQDDPNSRGRILTATLNSDLSMTNDGNDMEISSNQIAYIDIEAIRNL